MQVGSNLPVQNTTPLGGNTTVPNTGAATNQSAVPGAYPYGEDVFTGPYQIFKSVYSNFDNSVSKFSPFYGKMNSATETKSPDMNTPSTSGGLPPIPSTVLTNPVLPNTQSSDLPAPSQIPGVQQAS